MSKPVLEDLFQFSGRRNRKSYFLCILLFIPVGIVASLLMGGGGASLLMGDGGAGGSGPMAILGVLLLIPLAISGWVIGGQRCRDFGWTGWAVLISLIPAVGFIFAIALLFIPGNQGENRYGPDPLGTDDVALTAS